MTVRVPMPKPPKVGIVKRDRRWFWHPYTLGVMPNHPTGYTGEALYHDRRWWVMAIRYRHPDGWYGLGRTPNTRWRLVALWHGLRGHTHTEARP